MSGRVCTTMRLSMEPGPGAGDPRWRDRLDAGLRGGVAFLVARQEPAGCWVDFELPVGRATGWTTGYVATMLARCGAARAAVERAGHWLLATYRPGQGWAHRERRPAGWGYNLEVPPDGDSTAWALLALDAAGLPPTD